MPDTKPPPLQSPHDSLFKGTFGQPAEAAGLMQATLPAALIDAIEWGTLTPEPGSFVDEALKWRHTDLLFSVRRRGRELLLYFLIEHQSQSDRLMPLRISTYVHRALAGYVENHPGAGALPPVIPLVVSHGAQPWSAPVELLELFDLDESERTSMAAYLPKLRYFLDDLSTQTEQALRQRRLSDEGKLTMLALRQARVKSFVAALKRWAALLRRLQRTQGGRDKTARLLTYMLDVGDDAPDDLRDVLENHIGQEASEVIMSTAERLRQEGRLEGQAWTLLRQLDLKFGPVQEDVKGRLARATAEQLDLWTERVLSAASLEDVFGQS